MFLLGELLFGSVFHMFEAFLPLIIIALIVSLIVRHSKGKQTAYGYVKPGEVLMEGTDPNAKVATPNNAGSLNVLLYVGSFLIIGSILLFIKDEPSLVPFITIFATIIAYSAGILLYRFVEYLRPVATAFTYTAMVLFPLWYYAFNELGLASEVSLFVSTAITLVAYIGAAAGIDSRMAGWLSYVWLLLFGWTGASMIDAHSTTYTFTTYTFFIWPLIVALFPTICWACRVKWLPVAYRHATKFLAQWLTPIFAFFTFFTIFTPNMGSNYPALRIFAFSIATVGGLIGWIANRKDRGLLISLRIYLQLLVLMIIADATNYSVFAKNDMTVNVVVAIVWLVSWLAQTACSLFIPQETEKDKQIEKATLVFSLVGIFSTCIFCTHFDATSRAIVLIAIAAVIALLGALISWRYKNISWANATVLAIMFIPFEIFAELVPGYNLQYPIFFTYLVLTFVLIAGYAAIKNIQPKRSLGVAVTAATTGSVACIIASASTDWGSAGWLAASSFVASISLIAKQYRLLESAVYLAAVSFASFIGDMFDNAHINYNSNAGLNRVAIQSHILAAPLLVYGWLKERNNPGGARKILGYLALNIPMFFITMGASYSQNYILPMVYIFESTGFIILGAFSHHKWMIVTSSILLAITALELTGGFNGLWLMLAGIGLITFVAYQLVKNNKK